MSNARTLAPLVKTREGYDRWSQVYDDDANPLVALEEPVFDRLVGDVSGLDVLDVGCGTGRHTFRLSAAGGRVSALDFSSGMLDRARRKPGSERITFIHHDITLRLPLIEQSFDVVTCGLVLDHIHNLRPFFAELGRVCRPAGRIVCTVIHPAMTLKGVQARFSDPDTGTKIHIESAPHTISDYVSAAVDTGLRIDGIEEHAADRALAARAPRAEPYLGWPMLFALRLQPNSAA